MYYRIFIFLLIDLFIFVIISLKALFISTAQFIHSLQLMNFKALYHSFIVYFQQYYHQLNALDQVVNLRKQYFDLLKFIIIFIIPLISY